MNILSRLTFKSLVKNKVRTAVTIIGIVLSAAMLTAVTVSIASFLQFMRDSAIYTSGNWYGGYSYMAPADADALFSDSRVSGGVSAQILGYSEYENQNFSKPYLYVLGGDADFFSEMSIHLTDGRLPETEEEIILPEHLFTYGGERPELGSTITLHLGQRQVEGVTLSQFSALVTDDSGEEVLEELVVSETRTYTVVGYFQRPGFEQYSAPGYTALTGKSEASSAPLDVYYLTGNAQDIDDVNSLFSGRYGWIMNTDLLMFSGFSLYRSFYSVLYSLGAILIVLIMFGSVSLIYNAFSISVSDRTRQFGILSSVGATKKQIRRMVITEAVYVSIIGIPLGILSGIAGMAVTFHFIGSRIGSLLGTDSGAQLHVTAALPAILIAFAVAFITVLISAWIPSRRATRVTAMEAIRQANDVSIKPREVRISPLTYKLFGVEGVIAGKHFKRSRKRYRATVLSLFMSVVLFISASSFCRYLTDAVTNVFQHYDYDIRYEEVLQGGEDSAASNGYTLAEKEAILAEAEGVTRSSCQYSFNTSVDLPPEALTGEAVTFIQANSGGADEFSGYSISAYVVGVEDEVFREYLREQGLDEAMYFRPEAPLAVVKSQLSMFNSESGRYEKLTLLDPDTAQISFRYQDVQLADAFYAREDLDSLSDEEYAEAYDAMFVPFTADIGSHVTVLPFGLNRSEEYSLMVVYPMSVYRALFPSVRYEVSSILFKTNGHKAALASLEKTAQAAGIASEYLIDVYEYNETQMNLVTVIKVFAYGFITLISLIAAANVFNTISTNIHLRRREFAMLKSVGMSAKGFNKMMNYECLLYGTKSLLLGLPVAIGITYLIFRSVQAGYDTAFYLPWSSVALAIGSVFAVVFATMLYSMEKVKKDNPIDALKNETL